MRLPAANLHRPAPLDVKDPLGLYVACVAHLALAAGNKGATNPTSGKGYDLTAEYWTASGTCSCYRVAYMLYMWSDEYIETRLFKLFEEK